MIQVAIRHAPGDAAHAGALRTLLRPLAACGAIMILEDQAGDALRDITERQNAADVLLLLVTPDSLDQPDLINGAKGRVVPILLRPTLWEATSIANLRPLPANRTPILAWPSAEQAWQQVLTELRPLLDPSPHGPLDGNTGPPPLPLPPVPSVTLDWTQLLRNPKVHEQLSRFRLVFAQAREQISRLNRYKRLHDAFQEMEAPYKVLLRDRKRLAGSPEAWEDASDQLAEIRKWIAVVVNVLEDERLRKEFGMCKQQLPKALQALAGAEAGSDPKELGEALKHIQQSLARDPYQANIRLVTLAQGLPLGDVVTALQAAHGSLLQSAPDAGGLHELGRQIEDLGRLRQALATLVAEHNGWQEVDNEMRNIAEGAAGVNEEALLSSWPMVQAGVAPLLSAGGADAWAADLQKLGVELDQALARPAEGRDPVRVRRTFRDFFRKATERFVDVDKSLLSTCEALQGVGQNLDSLLKVLDGQD